MNLGRVIVWTRGQIAEEAQEIRRDLKVIEAYLGTEATTDAGSSVHTRYGPIEAMRDFAGVRSGIVAGPGPAGRGRARP